MTAITRFRGDTVPNQFTLSSSGVAVDITGYSFKLTLNPDQTPTDVTNQVYQLVGTIVDAPNGLFEFAPSAVQADLVGDFYYDIEMIDAGGAIKTLVVDKYAYVQDITKT